MFRTVILNSVIAPDTFPNERLMYSLCYNIFKTTTKNQINVYFHTFNIHIRVNPQLVAFIHSKMTLIYLIYLY